MFGFNTNHQAKAMWLNCLGSATRTMLACTIVALITLYTPYNLKHHISLPAFSYVTVILIITDATLGDTLRGCWLSLYASVQSLGPAMLCLWLIKPDRLTNSMTALAVALGGFVVVLPGPKATHLVSKRIALGQIVLVYIIGFINGPSTDPILHPLRVAASTALGVIACVLALLLPYPRLASYQVKNKSQIYVENATQRLKLYVKAFCGEDQIGSATSCITQAKSLSVVGHKLLQNLKNMQESMMKWEILPFKILRQYFVMPVAKLVELEMVLRGMELSTSSTHTSTIMLNAEIKEGLDEHLNNTEKQVKGWLAAPNDSKMVPESNTEEVAVALKSLQTLQIDISQLPSLFFLFCFNLLHRDSSDACDKHESSESKEDKMGKSFLNKIWKPTLGITNQNLMAAFKCFLSLGLAVFLGLIYSKPDGYWAGLPVAISLASGREATFKVANLKAQGTVLGTVYAVLICHLFRNSLPLRFTSLLPWFVFTSFLRKSKMYGQAGGISAVIGAVLILGRRGFGGPKEFAIARIVETFIGLFCSVLVDIVFQPSRASTMAKDQLAKCFSEFHLCVAGLSLNTTRQGGEKNQDGMRLKSCVDELSKYIAEAEAEPNFWFLKFNSCSYNRLKLSLTRAADYLMFGSHAIRLLESEVNNISTQSLGDAAENLSTDVKQFTDTVSCLAKCFEGVTKLKSVTELDKAEPVADVEIGKSPKLKKLLLTSSQGSKEEDEIWMIIKRYVQHTNNGLEMMDGGEASEAVKARMMVFLGAIGFCLDGLGKEVREMEKGVIEILQWENGASSHIDLYQIFCKLNINGCHQNMNNK